jgi:hypothetical protein
MNDKLKFQYKFIPVVAHNSKISEEDEITSPKYESFNDDMPFSLYNLGVPVAILKIYTSGKIKKEDLNSAKKAFKELKNFASQCSERTIADLCCKVIIEEITKMNNNQHLVVFIEKSASDKMLGRLATLYLNLDKITISFLTSDPSDLMTTVMSSQTGKLSFDIHRLMMTGINDFIGPYPGDFEESLIQTFFYKPFPLSEGGDYRPMRIDIFAQGLLRDKIEGKKEIIKQILSPESKDVETEDGEKNDGPRNLVPRGFRELKNYLDTRVKAEIERKLIEV